MIRQINFARRGSLLLGAIAASFAQFAVAQTSVSFQEGINGYAGSLEVFIGPDAADIPNAADGNVIGSTLPKDFLDGLYYDRGTPPPGDIQEIQLLMRYDNIFGTEAGRIPLGAKIIDAKMTFTTGDGGNAPSNGPYGIAQLLVPFDTSTTWNTMTALGGGGGATFPGGQIARPLDRGLAGPMPASSALVVSTVAADVTRLVQNWSSGQLNHGFLVRAGTTDGWEVFTSGVNTNTSFRPKLEVTYDASPQPPTSTVVLQQGVNNYMGTTMAWLQGPCPACGTARPDPITTDGATLDETFLDGPDLGGTSPDDSALIKFNNIFASQGGPVPDTANILDAFLVVDTAGVPLSNNVGTNGNFGVHRMLVNWDTTTLYNNAAFGGNGPDETQNEIGPVLDVTGATIADARTHLDVTSAVEAWQGGAANFGLSLRSADTADGWAIKWLNSTSPPQLVVNYTTAVIGGDTGDFDDDGNVDGRDFLVWQRNVGMTAGATLAMGDADDDNDVDDDDLAVWKTQFAQAGHAGPATGAVPEPGTAALAGALAVLAAPGSRRRRGP